MDERSLDNTNYREAIVDLLGLLAYGELQGYTRITADSMLAPTLTERARTGQMAVTEYRQYLRLNERIVDLGYSPDEVMEPFRASIDSFHAMTAPGDWLESLVKIYVGDGIARDFYLEISTFVDAETGGLIRSVFADRGQADFVITTVRHAIEATPAASGRLALWGRRLVGEALSQAQSVSAARESLVSLLVGGEHGLDLSGIGELFARLTERHTQRMEALGLDA